MYEWQYDYFYFYVWMDSFITALWYVAGTLLVIDIILFYFTLSPKKHEPH